MNKNLWIQTSFALWSLQHTQTHHRQRLWRRDGIIGGIRVEFLSGGEDYLPKHVMPPPIRNPEHVLHKMQWLAIFALFGACSLFAPPHCQIWVCYDPVWCCWSQIWVCAVTYAHRWGDTGGGQIWVCVRWAATMFRSEYMRDRQWWCCSDLSLCEMAAATLLRSECVRDESVFPLFFNFYFWCL